MHLVLQTLLITKIIILEPPAKVGGSFLAMKRYTPIVFIVFALLSLGSCCTKGPDDEVEYSDLFDNIANNMIVPRYAEFQSYLGALEMSVNAFDASDVSSLSLIQEQFKAAYLSWQSISVFEFGPAAEYSALLRANCNAFPANYSRIEENIEAEEYNLAFPSNYGAKGLPALDYLLFHSNPSDLLIELSDSSRMLYIQDCLADMQGKVDEVVNAWDSYRTTFVGSEGNDQNSSLSLLFNQFLYDYEKLKRDKFALPAGFATQFGIPLDADTSVVEGRFSKMSFQLIQANLESLENIYLGVGEDGVDGVGIFEKLKEYNAQSTVVDGDLAVSIQEQFSVCKDAISQFTNDLPFEIVHNIFEVQETSNQLQKMVPMLKNDMRSYLSVTVTLTDADGD